MSANGENGKPQRGDVGGPESQFATGLLADEERSAPPTICPHGDATCPCPDEPATDYCHYEGSDAMVCPNPPLGFKGVTWPHCHNEGCDWHVNHHDPEVGYATKGECGLLRLGLPPALTMEDGTGMYSMTQARPGLPGWPCGFLRTPLNVAAREQLHTGGSA